jgi:hypothetical protein
MNNRAAREGEEDAKYLFTSTVVISARDDADFATLRQDADWSVIEPPAGQRIWTDDYSNVIGAVIRQYWKTPVPDTAGSADTPAEDAKPADAAPAHPKPPAGPPPPGEPPKQ